MVCHVSAVNTTLSVRQSSTLYHLNRKTAAKRLFKDVSSCSADNNMEYNNHQNACCCYYGMVYLVTSRSSISTKQSRRMLLTPVAVTTGWCICSHHDPAYRQSNRGDCYSPMFSSQITTHTSTPGRRYLPNPESRTFKNATQPATGETRPMDWEKPVSNPFHHAAIIVELAEQEDSKVMTKFTDRF